MNFRMSNFTKEANTARGYTNRCASDHWEEAEEKEEGVFTMNRLTLRRTQQPTPSRFDSDAQI